MDLPVHFNYMVKKLRQFFQEEKGFIEIPTQSRLSILAACEQPETITQYTLGGVSYPLPQTGQMWLEHEILKNPTWPGVFCITTSYRDEPHIIKGRHVRIFPLFEFEAPGGIDALRQLEKELLLFLGFEAPVSLTYDEACKKCQVSSIEAPDELALEKELGHAISLEYFPLKTNPFWNMKDAENGLYKKIDVLLYGMETIGSAEREVDVEKMLKQFYVIEDGAYANLLFNKFGKDRVLAEMDTYLALPMIQRFGGGIGMTRLERAMKLAGLLEGFYTDAPEEALIAL